MYILNNVFFKISATKIDRDSRSEMNSIKTNRCNSVYGRLFGEIFFFYRSFGVYNGVIK